jgi:GH25 family lysozyme M1 (1,4-beta-N-acetylmuramidase)
MSYNQRITFRTYTVALLSGICLILYFIYGTTSVEKTPRAKVLAAVPRQTFTTNPVSYRSVTDTLYGLDMSRWNESRKENDYPSQAVSFCYYAATSGSQDIMPGFEQSWRELDNAGVPKGAYHIYQPGEDPVRQANHFILTMEKAGMPDLALAVKIQQHPDGNTGKFRDDLWLFMQELDKASPRKPVMYVSGSLADEYLTDSRFSAYCLWLYGDNAELHQTQKNKGFIILHRSERHYADSDKQGPDMFIRQCNRPI